MALPTSQETLWKCAVECGKRRHNKSCQHKWGSGRCLNCNVFILNYCDWDYKQVALFQRRADFKAVKMIISANKHHLVWAALLIIFLMLSYVSYQKEQIRKPPPQGVDPIQYTINKIKKIDVKKIDVNGDKSITCIDYAVQFYRLYPNQQEVRVIWNYNPPTMNHLFVKVGTIDVEPNGKGKSYLMTDVWDRQYNSAYNKDVTDGAARSFRGYKWRR